MPQLAYGPNEELGTDPMAQDRIPRHPGEPPEARRCLVVDGDPFARRALRAMLGAAGVEVVADVASADRALALLRRDQPDLLVMDVALPGAGGLELIRRVGDQGLGVRVVCVSACEDDEVALGALRLGAASWISKLLPPDELTEALRAACAGRPVLPPALTVALIDRLRGADGLGLRPVRSELTSREWEVLDLLSRGAGTRAIAEALSLSVDTVRTHVKNILRKLGVSSRADAVQAARRLRTEAGAAAELSAGSWRSAPRA